MRNNKFFEQVVLLSIIFIMGIIFESIAQTSDHIRVLSYNIRYKNTIDGINGWDYRKENIASLISFHKADIIGVQEADLEQLSDLKKSLPGFDWNGTSNLDNKGSGEEYNAILYNNTRFKILDSGIFWLSTDPKAVGSKSWDSFYSRSVSWCKFKDKRDKKIFFCFNTHFDHRGEIARQKSADVITEQINSIAGDNAAVVTGDFNSVQNSRAYQNLIQHRGINTGLYDAMYISEKPHFGPEGTSSGFWVEGPVRRKIDYVFVNNKVKVLQHAVLADEKDGRYFSDHLPVVADIQIKS